MNWYTIGSFTFPSTWAAVLISFLITGITLHFLFKKEQAADWYSNVAFVFIVTWKFSVILFYFQMSIKHPMTILYFDGGIKGYWLAIIAVLIYLFYAKIKQAQIIAVAWLMTVSVYELIYALLENIPLWMTILHVTGNILLFIMLLKKKQFSQWLIQIIILFTAFQLFTYSLRGELLSIPVLTYITIALFLVVYTIIRERKTTTSKRGKNNQG